MKTRRFFAPAPLPVLSLLAANNAFANDLTNGFGSYWTMNSINGDNTTLDSPQ